MATETQTTGGHPTDASLKQHILRFYDMGSPIYFSIYGEHFHDGYYLTGRESRKDAQENLISLLAEKANIQKGDHVLDVGCGVGGSAFWLEKNLGAVVLGITNSPVQIEIARKLAAERKASSQFLIMDAEKMHFEQSFDVIWIVAALTHFQDQEGLLRLASRFLKKQGRFVVYDWILGEDTLNAGDDAEIQAASRGLILASLLHLDSYRQWFTENGYRIIYAEDITGHTIKTWDDALAVIREPATWKLVPMTNLTQMKEFFGLYKGLGAMKQAMQKGKLRSAAFVAEKL